MSSACARRRPPPPPLPLLPLPLSAYASGPPSRNRCFRGGGCPAVGRRWGSTARAGAGPLSLSLHTRAWRAGTARHVRVTSAALRGVGRGAATGRLGGRLGSCRWARPAAASEGQPSPSERCGAIAGHLESNQRESGPAPCSAHPAPHHSSAVPPRRASDAGHLESRVPNYGPSVRRQRRCGRRADKHPSTGG